MTRSRAVRRHGRSRHRFDVGLIVACIAGGPAAAQAKEPPPPPPPTTTLTTITAVAAAGDACVGVRGGGFLCGRPGNLAYPTNYVPTGYYQPPPHFVPPYADALPDIVQMSGLSAVCGMYTDPNLGGAVVCTGVPGQALPSPLSAGTVQPVVVGVTQVTAGWDHACVVKADHSVWCWGANASGQLGQGSADSGRSIPTAVAALGQNVGQIAAGRQYTCALTLDGAVWCWGTNAWGQIANGTTDDVLSPVALDSLGHDNLQVAAGSEHACVLKTDGTVWCWGADYYGELGGPISGLFSAVPVQATVLGSGAVDQIATGQNHTCVHKPDGTVWCWGGNSLGQLGDGTETDSLTPVQVTGLGSVRTLSASGNVTCAQTVDGLPWCWGASIAQPVQMTASITLPLFVPLGGWRVDVGLCLLLLVIGLRLRRATVRHV